MDLLREDRAMSELSGWDVADHLVTLLEEVGYSFHSGDDGSLPTPKLDEKHWWCWSDGKCNVEIGESQDSPLAALMDAADHWFKNARIETQ